MTSVGVISSAVARIKRLKELQEKETTPFADHGVLDRLKEIKESLVEVYNLKKEEDAKLEIKEVVRLSYEIVDVFVPDSFRPVKSGTKMLKELVGKLTDVQNELTKKIRPEIVSAPSETASPEPEGSTGSPRSKKAGRENKPKGNIFGKILNNNRMPNIQKRTAGSDSDPLVGSKAPVLVQSAAGSDSDPLVGSKSPVLEQSTAGSDLDPLVVGSKAPVLEESTTSSNSQAENTEINIEQKSPSTTGSDQDPQAVGSKASAVLEQKPEIRTSEIQIEKGKDMASMMDRIKEVLVKPQENDSREVYIAGERGMGKSTLARNLYKDPDIRNSFDVSGWVTVGHNFQIKRVLQLLLQQLQQEQQRDLRQMNEMELIAQIFSVVKDKSYLLVLEEVGSMNDWESISLALPLTKSTRVIITTSSNDFDKCTNHYKISGLTQLETLALLKKEAIISHRKVGEAIYEISGGSPLYATILGKSLVSKADDPHLIDELVSYKPKRGTPQVLNASYRRLAPELKPCFLYLGLFPPRQHILVDKLYLLLLAENLISSPPPEEESEKSPDQYLREYLDKLAGLKLVEVEEDVQSRSGLYKSCRLHEQVQDFCISKGLDEEFLEVVDFKLVDSKQVVGSHTRRLAIYMRNYRGGGTSISFKGDASVKKILSLLVFDAFESAEGTSSGWPSGIGDLTDFTRLRVLSFEEVDFQYRKLPKGMKKLLLLRYLSFRGCFLAKLPSSLSMLTQLETLDLLVQDNCSVTIPDNIFTNMKRLVHLYLPRLYKGNGKTKLTLQGLEMLETLINFDTQIFEAGDLAELEKLKVLSTISNGENSQEMDAVIDVLNERASQLQHSSVEISSFDCYDDACSSALKKLLQCGFVDSVRIEGEIWELPEEGGVGERVAEMVLHGSELEDDLMGYLAKFHNLRSLVLADDAFVGTDITISSLPMFPKLRSLKLRNLQYLETLTIEEGALPELSSLQIESCGDAIDLTIPKELYLKLKNEIGGDAYSVVPSPRLSFNTTP